MYRIWTAALISIYAFSAQASTLLDDFVADPFGIYDKLLPELFTPSEASDDETPEEERVPGSENYVSVSTCMYGGTLVPNFLARLSGIAGYHHLQAQQLDELGFPREVWEEKLDRIVWVQIQAVRDLVNEHPDGSITDRSGAVPSSGRLPGVYYLEVELHNALVDYQNANPSNPAQLDLLDWCGGDFVGYVKVVSNPPDAAIKLLTQFSFEVCEALGKDPYSNDCEDWRQVTSEAIPAGLYKYVAAWPTGEVTCETVDLTPANGWPDGNEEPTIEIPKGGTSSCQPDSSSRSMSP